MTYLYASQLGSHCNNICKQFLMKWENAQGNMSYEEHRIQNYTFGQFFKISIQNRKPK